MTTAMEINGSYNVVLVANNSNKAICASVDELYAKLLDKDETTVQAIIKQLNMSAGYELMNEYTFNQYKLKVMNTEATVNKSVNSKEDAGKAFYEAKMRELQKGYMKLLANN